MSDNQKNKDTLLVQTLKVGEMEVPSEFRLFAYLLRYGRFKYLPFKIRKWTYSQTFSGFPTINILSILRNIFNVGYLEFKV